MNKYIHPYINEQNKKQYICVDHMCKYHMCIYHICKYHMCNKKQYMCKYHTCRRRFEGLDLRRRIERL